MGSIASALSDSLDILFKLHEFADKYNNISVVVENRSMSDVGFFTLPGKNPDHPQDWEMITPYVGRASLNKHTGMYESSSAIAIADVIVGQRINLITSRVSEEGALESTSAHIEIAFSSGAIADPLPGQPGSTRVRITARSKAKDGPIFYQKDARESFSDVADQTDEALNFAIGWAYNKSLLQIVIINRNRAF